MIVISLQSALKLGWDIFNLDIPTAMRMAEKVVPIVQRLEQESPKGKC